MKLAEAFLAAFAAALWGNGSAWATTRCLGGWLAACLGHGPFKCRDHPGAGSATMTLLAGLFLAIAKRPA